MTRPTRPPGPPYPDDEEPPEAGQPRFTPRQSGPQPPHEAASRAAYFPTASRRRTGCRRLRARSRHRLAMTRTRRRRRPRGDRRPGRRSRRTRPAGRTGRGRSTGGPGNGRPRPTFTPREGYVPPARPGAARPGADGVPAAGARGLPAAVLPAVRLPGGTAAPVPRFVPGRPRRPPPDVQDNRTRILEPDADQVPPTGPQRAAETTSPNLARSSKVMALGTVASRGTGFLRTLVLVIALGQGDARRRVQQLQHAAEHRVLPDARRHLHLGRGPDAGPRGQGGPGPGRGVRAGGSTRSA